VGRRSTDVSANRHETVQDLLPGLIDEREIDWGDVASTSYLIRQRFRYEYPAPIRNLRHRLIVIPPERHGGQRLVLDDVRVSTEGEVRRSLDAFGNTVVGFTAARVGEQVEFEARVSIERSAAAGPTLLAPGWLTDGRLLEPTELTAPQAPLPDIAASIAGSGRRGLDLARAVNEWAHGALTYECGVTGIHTTAAQALALGAGVCQDYAHIMLAVCRVLGLSARYVSGHLLGEGGTHAWVEVLLPDPSGSGLAAAFPFDPTQGGGVGLRHMTIATGRDYSDVAPTSGTYWGEGGGILTASKRVDITSFEYARQEASEAPG